MPTFHPIATTSLLTALVLNLSGCPSAPPRPADSAQVTVDKQPANIALRKFDRTQPPPDMPALRTGEEAACESNFLSNATVGGESQPIDSTHATLTVTRVKMRLMLKLTIWVPADATHHVIDHEQGHREIAESYYQSADKLASQIGERYLNRRIQISGSDLTAESNKALQQIATEITAAYNHELNPEPAQLLYDDITDHSRNDVSYKDAVTHALKNAAVEAPSAGRS